MTTLTKLDYPTINEDFFYSKLTNGLQVYLIKKKGYLEKTAMLTVNFGSLDTHFTVNKKAISSPSGIAHFLEHKLFEDDNGEDIALQFTELGAETNAFTTFEKTSYFFSTTGHLEKNLELLQDFVLSCDFTDSSVNREKDIIAQEIDMYQDDPDYRAYSGILQNLFPNTSLAQDIAGTKESIQDITADVLKDNHAYFYHPSNMSLLIVGDIDVNQTVNTITAYQNQKSQKDTAAVTVAPLVYHPVIKSQSIDMDITTAKLVVGFRSKLDQSHYSLQVARIALRLLLSMLFGWTSQTYQEWYEAGKIDDSFDLEIEIQQDFQFVLISLDTNEPIAMSDKIRKTMKQFAQSSDLTTEHLNLLKREMYGDFIQSLDSIEQLTSQFNLYLSDKETYFDIPSIIEKLTLKDLFDIANAFFKEAEVSDFTVFPK
ncbi:EF-P 5-aminopentanol modification-associated protein YfmH [Streptococcus phocae]|uniref:Peptidase M16 n=1 Tax=Streptococcus phocae TaxID=119224 RepID=A0A0P6SJB1_9STRE|nr:pitrilysin family protein [Streptococcus phocae]KPJ22328.1 peptidase M16 [Streptococcus phocae]